MVEAMEKSAVVMFTQPEKAYSINKLLLFALIKIRKFNSRTQRNTAFIHHIQKFRFKFSQTNISLNLSC